MLRVLGRVTSINARKVLWAADEMGLVYEHEIWGKPDRDPNVTEFLALNPNGQVPVIIDDGFVLWESNTILRYLANKWRATSLLPTDPRARAEVERWIDWQATEFNTAWRYAFSAIVRQISSAPSRPVAFPNRKSPPKPS